MNRRAESEREGLARRSDSTQGGARSETVAAGSPSPSTATVVDVLRSPFLVCPDQRREAALAALTSLNTLAGQALSEVGGTARAGQIRSCAVILRELNAALDESELLRSADGPRRRQDVSQLLERLERGLAGADWFYERADDARAFQRGRERMQAIRELAKALETAGAARAVALLWREYAPVGSYPPLAHAQPFNRVRPDGRSTTGR